MSWTFGGVRVYANDLSEQTNNIIARLQPLNAKTILHRFGYESDVYKFAGVVATDADKDTLKGYARTNTAYSLSGAEGVLGDFYVKAVKTKRLPTICTILFDRPSMPKTSPLYNVQMDLFIDD